ncbi:hypothetical protein XENORESO_005313 [Xenotaenia resolanae]|uniref:Uncharacterized protein n=1 Tax=Xenotaenia resolanae TaxID=208358 RepID=A0ABV0W990_9TELE
MTQQLQSKVSQSFSTAYSIVGYKEAGAYLQQSMGERRGTPWTGRQSITNSQKCKLKKKELAVNIKMVFVGFIVKHEDLGPSLFSSSLSFGVVVLQCFIFPVPNSCALFLSSSFELKPCMYVSECICRMFDE